MTDQLEARRALKIGNVVAQPGTLERGGIPVGTNLSGEEKAIPVIVVRGMEDGPVLWLNGATHGDEPEGAFSIFLTLKQLDPARVRGTVVAIPAMNVDAFGAGHRGNPSDTFSYDMNRVYPGRPDGYPTERIAHAHWSAMDGRCDLQIAIHSGGEHSYLTRMIFAGDNDASRELAATMGPRWDLVFRSGTGSKNPAGMVASRGKAGITVELGGNCRTLTGDFHSIAADLSDAYLNVMRHFKMIEGQAVYADGWRMGHQIAMLAPATGMFVGSADLLFGEPIPEGTPLGVIYNLYGDVAAEVRAPQDGIVFGLRSRPAVLEGEWCCFFGVIEETRDDLIPTSL